MRNRLYSGVVVVLVQLTVESLSGLLVAMRPYSLLCHSGVYDLIDIGTMALARCEFGDGVFGSLHVVWRVIRGGLVWGVFLLTEVLCE